MSKEKEELNLEEKSVEKKKITNRKNNTKANKMKEEKKGVSTTQKQRDTKPNSKANDFKKSNMSSKTIDIPKGVENNIKKQNKVNETTLKDNVNKKTISSKEIDSSKKIKEKNSMVTPNEEKGKVKEETIIEKIKSFISKIIAMQEEAKNEDLAKKEKKKTTQNVETPEKSIDEERPVYLTEYYDLPYRYNETVVKILAQTPKRIFVYWDIADEDRIRYERAFGKDFFEKTYPVLLVHNNDKDYTTEIPINDFANSWYININDPKTKYTIQLGRKFREIPKNIDMKKVQEENIVLRTDYLPITQSNILEVPNDHILFATMPAKITYRNVKTYEEKQKDVSNIQTPYGVLYDIKEFYDNNYKDEIEEEIFDFNNPTSGGLSSSSFK